jgi:hypothetical protein|tara:strand:+ start:1607 stop:1717 length:111 start_codon:yes stop_codon:yes gene_type:complete
LSKDQLLSWSFFEEGYKKTRVLVRNINAKAKGFKND